MSCPAALCLLTLVCLLCRLAQHSAAEGRDVPILSGVTQRCKNEGERVIMEEYIKNHCFSCICKNGLVECHSLRPCPTTDGCYLLKDTEPGECCQKCHGCMHNGKYRESHTEWTDPEDPCVVFRCEAGLITTTQVQCYTPCAKPLPPKSGKCCGTCPGCRINGQNVTRDVTIPEDPCVKCHCEADGRTTCIKRACPVLHCTITPNKQSNDIYQRSMSSRFYHPPRECCPICNGTRRFYIPPNICIIGKEMIPEGKTYHPDACTVCQCINGTGVCRKQTCPVLDCAPDLQTLGDDKCCPTCEDEHHEEFKSVCTSLGKTYQDGEEWPLDACSSCKCNRGEMRCAMQRCPKVSKCPPGSKRVKLPGECCEKCQENDAICTVFGDPHYKTFDGKFFSFQGSCKYQLVADCLNNTFSVRVTNDPRNTRFSSWTRTVAIKVGPNLKVNLGQKLRVKVNGKRMNLPTVLQNGGKIEKENDTVMVDLKIGLKVIWDGRGFLEVIISPIYKGKLCGLCGNFNSIASDDLTMRNKKIVTDNEVWKFANSWKVGGKKSCGRLNETFKKPQCKNKNSKHLCRALKFGLLFGECDTKLSPQNYYDACIQDMCECPHQNCYCEAFSAYARECQRLGAIIPSNWRQSSKCYLNGKSFNAQRGHRRFNHHEKQNRKTNYNNKRIFLNELTRLPRPRNSQIGGLPIQ